MNIEENNQKLTDLKDLVLSKAEAERGYALSNARKESKDWLKEQNVRLEQTIEGILMESGKRAEDIRRRELVSAERERERERLRLQNSLIEEAVEILETELVKLRDREDHVSILSGVLMESVASIPPGQEFFFRLAERDSSLSAEMMDMARKIKPDLKITFDEEPAPILGGLWLRSRDGRWQVNADWHVKAREMADELAERLLRVL